MTSLVFDREQELVSELLRSLESPSSPWGEVVARKEFFYQRGRTDVVALSAEGKVIAFEAKLERWRDALHQAYRNLCFAHSSYVVLPKAAADKAERFLPEFARRGVGLCYLEDGKVILLCDSSSEPLQPWLAEVASRHARNPED